MDLAALLVTLPIVFLAAFLAVLLENARERLRTRKWVVRNLKALADLVAEVSVREWIEQEQAVQRWLAAESPEELDEQTWQRCHLRVASTAPDISALLRSDAATSVSVEVFRAMHGLDEVALELRAVEPLLNESFRDVLPLWYEREVPLPEADARRVAAFRDLLVSYWERLVKAGQATERFRQAVAQL